MYSPEVTITLVRSGQVVTKGGKRSRGEGVGSNGDSYLFSSNKRNRRDGTKQNLFLHGANGSQIAHNDLRLKLMHKRLSKKIHNSVQEKGKIDPPKKLAKAIHPPISSVSSHKLTHGLKPSGSNLSKQILRKEIADDLHQVVDEIRRPMPVKTVDVSRGGRFLSEEILDSSRLTTSPSVIMKPTSQGEEPQTVAGFLHSLGLGKCGQFSGRRNMAVLKQIGDKDLKEMGIPMGPRKKIHLALLARPKRQAS